MDQETFIDEITRNERVRIVVKIKPWNGKTYVDIRDHFLERKSGAWMHTKKGITVNASLLSALITALEKAEAKLTTTQK